MRYLVTDTETTGLPIKGLPYDHPKNPCIVQLGAILYDENWRVRAELNLIIKPEENYYTYIPPEASNVHGVTVEIAEQCGVPLIVAMMAFNNLIRQTDAFVAHNAGYDIPVIKKAYSYLGKSHPFDSLPQLCTMVNMIDVMKLQSKFGKGFGWPSLMKAYGYVTDGGTFEGAHDAMADVRACAEVLKWGVQNQWQPKSNAA